MKNIVFWSIFGCTGFLIILCICYYNIMMKKENGVKNAFSSLDVMLKKRYDLIPNLVECVKSYANYEQQVLSQITQLRKESTTTDTSTVFRINNELTGQLSHLLALSENYPDLKANKNFIHLQNTLSDVEEHISAARRTYNAHVTSYNNFIHFFPNLLFAKLFDFHDYSLFQIDEDDRRVSNWYGEDEK